MSKETVTYKGFEFEYNLYYEAEEKQTFEHQGCGEFFEISEITLDGKCAMELLDSQIDEFDEFVIKELKNYDPY